MSNTVANDRAQFTAINTDFGYDALGGVGKTGRLGSHEVEVLEAPSTRASTRIAGPEKTVGRWFAKVLDSITPSSWRAQGKFQRGLEDFSAQTNRILGQIFNSGLKNISADDKSKAINTALTELASLRKAAEPMTSRGTDYKELLTTRVAVDMEILRKESPNVLSMYQEIKAGGRIDEIINSLDISTQKDMIEDLKLIKDSIPDLPEPKKESSPFSFKALKEYVISEFTVKGRVLDEIARNQGALEKLGGEAKDLLKAAADAIKHLGDDIAHVDVNQLSEIQKSTEDELKKVTELAINGVCQRALEYLDSNETAGVEGSDFTRVSASRLRLEIDAFESRAKPADGGILLSESTGSKFAQALNHAREQIRDISELYGEISDNIAKIAMSKSRYENAQVINEISKAMPSEHTENLNNKLIEYLESGDYKEDVFFALNNFAAAFREDERVGDELVQKGEQMVSSMRHMFEPYLACNMSFAATDEASDRLATVAELKELHGIVGRAGALLQQAQLPQADMLTAQALKISRDIVQLETAQNGSQGIMQNRIKNMQADMAAFMSNVALARMQMENPNVRSAQAAIKGLNDENRQKAADGFELMQRGLKLLSQRLDAGHGKVLALAALGNGSVLIEKGLEAARACAALEANIFNKEHAAAAQLAVCLESGRKDAELSLKSMLEDKKWDKGKHLAAKNAINAFSEALSPIKEARAQDQLLVFLSSKFGNNIKAHDIYRSFDGSIHMLINTDRQKITGDSKDIQGTKWVTLPDPDKLADGNVATGVNRIDELLSTERNRVNFYTPLYNLLNDYFNGELIDFSL